jgi:glucan phosphoethanolaminetransferase (alkaline phosphatase superfamily)
MKESLFARLKANQKEIKTAKAKGYGYLMMSPIFVMLAATNIGDTEPVSHLFGLIEYFVSILLVMAFLWAQIGEFYPAEKIKRARIYGILSSLSVLAFAPLMVGLMTWRFQDLYKEYKKIRIFSKASDVFNDDKIQMILIAILVLWVGTGFYLYDAVAKIIQD